MNNKLEIFSVCMILLLSACKPPVEYSSEPLQKSTIFTAEGIDNAQIQYIWLELPVPTKPGIADVRLFLAKTEPSEPNIPNPNDIRCTLLYVNEKVMLGPERIPFEFKEDGTFTGSYTYKACPECIECYMNWDYTLKMTGSLLEESVLFEIAIKHFGHNVQGSYLSTELNLFRNANKEPRITCNRMIECSKIVFVTR